MKKLDPAVTVVLPFTIVSPLVIDFFAPAMFIYLSPSSVDNPLNMEFTLSTTVSELAVNETSKLSAMLCFVPIDPIVAAV